MVMKIGIGFTTHNRNEMIRKAVTEARKYTPGAKVVVVDDCSDVPVKGATYRFKMNAGIARAKNKCIELLSDCDYLFLFDDDTWPKADGWAQAYIETARRTNNEHLCMTWPAFANGKKSMSGVIKKGDGIVNYSHPCGCMLFLTRKVIETVGGMDSGFGRWGDEHVEYSNRIYNARLTNWRYIDVADSLNLIHASDWHGNVAASITQDEKNKHYPMNHRRMVRQYFSKDYKAYV